MRFFKQFLIILTISLFGEILSFFIPLPIPANIYGLILMFCALQFKIVKLPQVKETGKFLTDVMPIMFIPPGVAILDCLDVLKAHWWQIVLITIVSTFIVMIVAGWVAQIVMTAKRKLNRRNEND